MFHTQKTKPFVIMGVQVIHFIIKCNAKSPVNKKPHYMASCSFDEWIYKTRLRMLSQCLVKTVVQLIYDEHLRFVADPPIHAYPFEPYLTVGTCDD